MPARRSAMVALLVIVALALAGGGWALTRQLAGTGDTTKAGPTAACAGRTVVHVTAVPEIVDTVRAAATRTAKVAPCTDYDVTAAPSAAVAVGLRASSAPDVWVPDSSTWLDVVGSAAGDAWTSAGSVTGSPVVLATPTARAAAVGRPVSWAAIVNGKLELSMADPDLDTASRLAYLASRSGAASKPDLTTGARLIVMSRSAKTSAAASLAAADEAGDKADPFPVSEQQLAAWVREHSGSTLRPVLPAAGTVSLDYPWLVSTKADAATAKAATALADELKTPAGQTQLTAAGFRGPGQGPTIGGTPATETTELDLPSAADRVAAVVQWDVLRIDLRMLAVMDVSGSMREAIGSGGGPTRFEVLQGAAVKALQILPSGSQVGGWVFSTAQGGPRQDWRVLAPIARLDKRGSGGTTHRDTMSTLIKGSTKYLGGDTGLYDTTLAAYREMGRSWDGGYVNSVVVMTDGVNDDTTGGIDLKTLIATLKREADRAKPVRIITIGMGEADPSALKQISAATGGTSYIANSPADIQRVFVAALLARPLPTS